VSRAECGSLVDPAPPRPRALTPGASALPRRRAAASGAPTSQICSSLRQAAEGRRWVAKGLICCRDETARSLGQTRAHPHASAPRVKWSSADTREDAPATWSGRRGRAWCGYSESRSPGVASAASARRPRQAHPARATSAAPSRASTPCRTSAGSSARPLHRPGAPVRCAVPAAVGNMRGVRLLDAGAHATALARSAAGAPLRSRATCLPAAAVRRAPNRPRQGRQGDSSLARGAAQAAPCFRARRGARRAAPAGARGKAGSAGSGSPADASAKHDARLPPHTRPVSGASAAPELPELPQPRRRRVPLGGRAASAKGARRALRGEPAAACGRGLRQGAPPSRRRARVRQPAPSQLQGLARGLA